MNRRPDISQRRSTAPSKPPAMTLLAMAAALSGCANLGQDEPQALRIEPVLRVSSGHGGGTLAGYLALGRQYAGQGRWSHSAQALAQAALLDPRNADTFNQLGRAEAMLQRYPAAVAAFERAVALAPERVDLLNNLGYTLMLDGRPALAAAVLTLALQRAPDYEAARINLQQADIKVAQLRATQTPTQTQQQLASTPQSPDAERATAAAPPPTIKQPSAPLADVDINSTARFTAMAADAGSVVTSVPTLQTIRSQPHRSTPLLVVSAPNVPALATASLPAIAAVPVQLLDAAITEPPPIEVEAASSIKQTNIVVLNGNGVTGAAARLGQRLTEKGLRRPRLANLLPYRTETTTVQYRAGFAREARAIARLLPMSSLIEPATAGASGEVRVIIGHDVAYSQACSLLAATCRSARPVAKAQTESSQAV